MKSMFCFSPAKKQANLCNLKILFLSQITNFQKKAKYMCVIFVKQLVLERKIKEEKD